MEKLLPQNIEAECGVLGSIIIDPEAITLVSDMLDPRDFYRDSHRTIFEVIIQLYQDREPADFIMICDELERRGRLDDVGGASYITSLINGVPTSGNVEHYARIVKNRAVERRLIHAAGQIAALAYESEPDALARAEELVLTISKQAVVSDFEASGEIMGDVLTNLEHLHDRRGNLIGVPTGFDTLDRCLGGLQKSDLVVVAGRPGMGKTSFALSIAYNAALHHNQRVAMFSLEMSKRQLMQRLISMDTGINSQLLRNGFIDDEDWERIVPAGDRLAEAGIWIDDTGGLPIHAARSRIRRLHAENPVHLIIVDYLQLMHAYRNGKIIEPRLQELQEISGELKALAKDIDVPVLALAQLSRDVEKRQSKMPQLSDLRESGSIENDADVVIFLYREDYYNSDSTAGDATAIVAKHRNGPTGDISLYFDGPHARFFNDENEKVLAYAK